MLVTCTSCEYRAKSATAAPFIWSRMPRCDFLRGIQIEGIKKALRTCYLQRVRPAQHKPVGRDALFLRRKGFRGNQAHANAWAFCVLKGFAR
nr:MAG TPA: hypothetical protein [Caudoviricetes sp.]